LLQTVSASKWTLMVGASHKVEAVVLNDYPAPPPRQCGTRPRQSRSAPVAPTGRAFRVIGNTAYALRDGRISALGLFDVQAILVTLGIVPPLGG
jgi:hypothetical protein